MDFGMVGKTLNRLYFYSTFFETVKFGFIKTRRKNQIGIWLHNRKQFQLISLFNKLFQLFLCTQ